MPELTAEIDSSTAASPALARRWHSMTSRLITVYVVIFSLSVIVLLGFIGWGVTGEMESETDVVMNWQLIYFDSLPHAELADAIHRRLERERMHTNYYGLFSPDGQHIAGDILSVPAQLTTSRVGTTLDGTLSIEGDEHAPVVRAMAKRTRDGDMLVVARDLTHILSIREAIINTLIGGGLFCLIAGIAGGLGLNMRQMRRLKAIRRVTQCIAQGDLGQRLPIGGRDEIDMLVHLVNHMLAEVERLMHEVKSACDGIAHDLRTPLAHVRTLLAHIAERSEGVDDPSLSTLVERARTETDGLLNRFRAMLRISEIGTLQRRGGFAEVRLDALVHEVGELYEPLAESRGIEFVVQVRSAETIHGDHALLFEAFSNLVDNALKFTPPGGTVRISLTATHIGPRVDVVDNGPGIAASERDAVLQRFYRGAQTHHIAGSGLGLSIVSAVMHVHDFTLHIDSAEPGTRVTVECWMKTLE